MNINKLIEYTQNSVYNKHIEIPSLGINLLKYKPIEEKFGLAKRLFAMLYDSEANIYDGVNAKMFIPVFFIEAYCDDIQLPKNVDELDITGIYDALCASGALEEIHTLLKHEIEEVESIINELVKIEYRKFDSKNVLADFLGNIVDKNPEDIEKMTSQIKELMQDENVRNMIKFKEQGDH